MNKVEYKKNGHITIKNCINITLVKKKQWRQRSLQSNIYSELKYIEPKARGILPFTKMDTFRRDAFQWARGDKYTLHNHSSNILLNLEMNWISISPDMRPF